MSKYEVISGPYFSVFGLNTGEYGPEITLYLDTFHPVLIFRWSFLEGQKSFIIIHKLKESEFIALAEEPTSSLHIEECDFNSLIFNKIFYMELFGYINHLLTAKYTIGKILSK